MENEEPETYWKEFSKAFYLMNRFEPTYGDRNAMFQFNMFKLGVIYGEHKK